MARYIDAGELVQWSEKVDLTDDGGIDINVFDEYVQNSPTIDAVPVVRCKDCIHNSLKRMSGNTYCDLGMGLFQLYDFCSLGERKEQ